MVGPPVLLAPPVDLPSKSSAVFAPDVALTPPRERSSPPGPKPAPRPAPATPSRPRRIRAGLVAVVLGALGVAAVREFVGDGDDDDVGSAVETPGTVTVTSISSGTTPDAAQPVAPANSAPTSAVPTDSAAAPIDPAIDAPETPVSLDPTATTNSVPPAGATLFSGVGNFVIELNGYDLSRKILVVSHNGVAAFELSMLDGDLNQLALVESVVGPLSGTYPLGFEGDATPSYLRIDADGDWTIEIKPVEEARVWQADLVSGTGADVLRFEGGASVVDYSNAGSSNFIVQYHRNPGFDLLVNEIGPIAGTTTMPAGPGVVVVDAAGDWTLSARPV
jgi:hypothetical protein